MSFDQTRRQKRAAKIDNLLRVVIAKTDHATIVHRHVRGMNFAAKHVYELRVLEKLLRRLFPARNGELVLNLSHPAATAARCSDERRRCSIAIKIASGVAGDGSAICPPGSPKAATASRMASRTEIASINGGSPTALLP